MFRNSLLLISLAVASVVMNGCSGSDSSVSNVSSNLNTNRETSDLFPHSFVLSSLSDGVGIENRSRGATTLSTTQRIEQLLAGTLPLNNVFTPELLYSYPARAECFGPKLKYDSHPDGALPNSGELPTGDLGIWLKTEGSTTQACATAQLDARMNGVKDKTMSGLFLMASSLDAMYDANLTLPSVGASALNLTAFMPVVLKISFKSVTIEQPSADEFHYFIDFTYNKDVNTSYDIEFETIHKAGTTPNEFKGLMKYQIQDSMNGGNCGSGWHDITKKGSLVYERIGLDEFKVDSREADFCTHSFSSGFDTNNLLNPSDRYDSTSNLDGWGNNYANFIANYKPSNLAGQYLYIWQAGMNDSHSRVLQVGLNDHTPVDGESYFGYAAQVFNTTATQGENLGLICNWAAPGGTATPQLYAQRQFIEYNATLGFFQTPTGGSDITYAPTNNCIYDGTGSFTYDRDINGSIGSEDIAVVKVAATGVSELEFDLFDYNGSTVAEMISNRGATLPVAPVWP